MRASTALLASVVALAACGGASAPSPRPSPTPATSPTPKSIVVIANDEVSDADGDGVIDSVDACPHDPEDHDGFDDADGCPDADNDKDGIADALDKCPNEPETYDGKDDDDGCPDSTKVIGTVCPIIVAIRFAAGSAKLPPDSKAILDEAATLMGAHPELLVVGVEGFADDPGGAAANVAISQKRAEAAMKELEARGVATARLRAKGFGAYCPIEGGATAAAKQHNRRVTFHVLETTSGITGEAAGCPEATKHGLVLTP